MVARLYRRFQAMVFLRGLAVRNPSPIPASTMIRLSQDMSSSPFRLLRFREECVRRGTMSLPAYDWSVGYSLPPSVVNAEALQFSRNGRFCHGVFRVCTSLTFMLPPARLMRAHALVIVCATNQGMFLHLRRHVDRSSMLDKRYVCEPILEKFVYDTGRFL